MSQATKQEEKPVSMEPVTREQLEALRRAVGGFMAAMVGGLTEVDLTCGRGVLANGDRCLWTHWGNRVTVSASYGTVIVRKGRDVDPHWPKATKGEG